MVIKKKYHFYASHRNQFLKDKCYNLHGHVYRILIVIESKRNETGIAFLFNDIDLFVEPLIEKLDHSCLVHIEDEKLVQALQILGTKAIEFEHPTTVENLAVYMFDILKKKGLPIIGIEVMETESSTVSYYP